MGEPAGHHVDFFAKLGVESLHEGRTKAEKDAKKQEVAQFNDAALPIFDDIANRYSSIQDELKTQVVSTIQTANEQQDLSNAVRG